jgi:hypothetical protein
MPKLKAGGPTLAHCVTACSVYSQIPFISAYPDAIFTTHCLKMHHSMVTRNPQEKLKGRDHLDDLGVDETIISNLMQILYILYIVGDGFIWLRVGTVMGSCEHGNKHMGFIKREFLDYLSNYNRRIILLHGVTLLACLPV